MHGGRGGRVPGLHGAGARGRARLLRRDQAQTGMAARGRQGHRTRRWRDQVRVLRASVPEAVPWRRAVRQPVLPAGPVLGAPRAGVPRRPPTAAHAAEQSENVPGRRST